MLVVEGAVDDYIARPVRAGDLVARIEAHRRRVAELRAKFAAGAAQPRAPQSTQAFGNAEVDLIARTVAAGARSGSGPWSSGCSSTSSAT